ncbi:MAG: diaminopropionate ammonia-lyase [Clostridiales Family XIII bacterium]|jgi:diaminopropionate ammonia-lyase|nr:diaminopropionate ammonia-lyase [Clostridiales Family XIII bacterium]
MRERINWISNKMEPSPHEASLALLAEDQIKKVRGFHKSFPIYEPTPLVGLDQLAKKLGIKNFFLKDESYRFGLNAFKVLGGSYAVGKFIAQRLGKDISEISYETMISAETKAKVGDITFYTATDGNHGRGVAWAANKLGQKSVIAMPVGSSQTRLKAIQAEGAEATITDMNYDDAVRYVNGLAEKDPNGVMVQDTAWDGYEEIPSWIMQGYSTMAAEADEQLHDAGIARPTHVFVQAGVGSFAGAVQGYFANAYKEDCPITTIVEANVADCIYRSAQAGKLVPVGGDMQTIMAGLACGEACTISWDILKNKAKFFVSAPDWVSAFGMRMLAAPLRGDRQVVSGESGSVTSGLVATLMEDDTYQDFREALGLNEDSVVLVFSSEGDTDPAKYKSIVWDGECPSVK